MGCRYKGDKMNKTNFFARLIDYYVAQRAEINKQLRKQKEREIKALDEIYSEFGDEHVIKKNNKIDKI